MTNDLFPDCKQDSPRLAWMKRNHLKVIELESVSEIEEDEFGNKYGRFNVVHEDYYQDDDKCFDFIGIGMTLDEALEKYAQLKRIPLWNEEAYAAERSSVE